jgi:hypothetical protein
VLKNPLRSSYLRVRSIAIRRYDGRGPLIELELGLVILRQLGILILFAQEAVAYRQHFHIGAHETPRCISDGSTIGEPILKKVRY